MVWCMVYCTSTVTYIGCLLMSRDWTPDCHAITCDRKRSHAIACDRMRSRDRMRSHAISCDRKPYVDNCPSSWKCIGNEKWDRKFAKVFLHDNCEQISFIIFFAFLKKEEMRSGTHFTQLNVFLLLTVVVTKHVWPYFQSRFTKTSSERVSSCGLCEKKGYRTILIFT